MEFKPIKTKRRSRGEERVPSAGGFVPRSTLHAPRSTSAATLVEMMVAVGVAGLLLGFVASFYVVSARSFASFGCYTDLNKQDRYTSDLLTRDIRSAAQVLSYSSTQLNLSASDGSFLSYTYYAGSNTLVRTNGGISRILLRDISPGTFSFSVYQRPTNASPTFEQFPAATNAANVKLIGFQWSCSTTVPATTIPHSESLKSGLVSIRNQ